MKLWKKEGRRKKEEGKKLMVSAIKSVLTVLVVATKIYLWVDTTHSFYL